MKHFLPFFCRRGFIRFAAALSFDKLYFTRKFTFLQHKYKIVKQQFCFPVRTMNLPALSNIKAHTIFSFQSRGLVV